MPTEATGLPDGVRLVFVCPSEDECGMLYSEAEFAGFAHTNRCDNCYGPAPERKALFSTDAKTLGAIAARLRQHTTDEPVDMSNPDDAAVVLVFARALRATFTKEVSRGE